MTDIAIKVENLSKLYQLGTIGTGTLSRDLQRWYANIRGKEDPFAKVGQVNDRGKKAESDFVWALKDIDFEVKKGEVMGIIGRNGAGKSTLLKILSKITSPTSGKIIINGRIASLLEVGTGFHPELTGRENIFMNGAILGMHKWEIEKKFDEIVDFSGVEAYIDTPVKRYSSGMYVRLAFAVATFLEPEILIVDEVLAVGDVEFQKKCLGRMKDVSVNDGRAVLFVSHNIEAVKTLCSQGLLLTNGMVEKFGDIQQVIENYIAKDRLVKNNKFVYTNDGDKSIYIQSAFIIVAGKSTNVYRNNELFEIEITVGANVTTLFSFEFLLKDQNQNPIIFCPIGLLKGIQKKIDAKSIRTFKLRLGLPFLAAGSYFLDLMLVESGRQFYHYAENALSLEIESNYIRETGWSFTQQRGQGAILLEEISIEEN